MKLIWCTDIHLDHLQDAVFVGGRTDGTKMLSKNRIVKFCDAISARNPDFILITGDISIAPLIEQHIELLEENITENAPIYFVLGNHDYYGGSIMDIRAKMAKFNGSRRATWLNTVQFVPLTKDKALVGHDGWYDGGYAPFEKSRLYMNDVELIKEFRFKHPLVQQELMRTLAREGAEAVTTGAKAALGSYKNILVATHAPCFRENSRAPNGALSDANWLPYMSSKCMGDAVYRLACENTDNNFTCFSGHTHTKCDSVLMSNLREMTGHSKYGFPANSIREIDLD
jgi:predicted MPP superfamily phosphohydrolase